MKIGPSPCHHDVDQVVQTHFEYNVMEWRSKDVPIEVKQGMKTAILRWRRVSVCPSCQPCLPSLSVSPGSSAPSKEGRLPVICVLPCPNPPPPPPPQNPTTKNKELNCVEFLAVGMVCQDLSVINFFLNRRS